MFPSSKRMAQLIINIAYRKRNLNKVVEPIIRSEGEEQFQGNRKQSITTLYRIILYRKYILDGINEVFINIRRKA